MKRVLLSGYYGFDNSGDDAILYATIQELRRRRSDLLLEVLSYHPEKTREHYGVESVNRFDVREVSRALRRADVLVSGGGSLLQDVTSSRSLWYYLLVMLMAKWHRAKLYVYANGIGPIDGGLNRRLAAWVLKKADAITLRDPMSRDFLASLGLEDERISVTADPVYALEMPTEEEKEALLKRIGLPRRSYLGVALRPWKHAPALYEETKTYLCKLLEETEEEILLLPLHEGEDRPFFETMFEDLGRPSRLHLLPELSVEEMIGAIGCCHAMVAMRLHALIYATLCEVPMVAVSYDPKVKALAQMLELPETIDVKALKSEDLFLLTTKLLSHEGERREALSEKHRLMQERARKNLDVLDELLEGHGGKNSILRH